MSRCYKTNTLWVFLYMYRLKEKKKWTPKIKNTKIWAQILFWIGSKKIFGSKRSYFWTYVIGGGGQGGVLHLKITGKCLFLPLKGSKSHAKYYFLTRGGPIHLIKYRNSFNISFWMEMVQMRGWLPVFFASNWMPQLFLQVVWKLQ